MTSTTRMKEVYRKSCEFILTQQIHALPVNPFDIIQRNKWGLVSYKRLAEICGQASRDIPLLCNSKDGFTLYNGRNYCIAYNHEITPFNRITFTLMHEIGHIYLGHLKRRFNILDQNNPQYQALEVEANAFASNVLAPFIVMQKCNMLTKESLHCGCGLSFEASQRRLDLYMEWRPTREDYLIFRVFHQYIRSNFHPRVHPCNIDLYPDETVKTLETNRI